MTSGSLLRHITITAASDFSMHPTLSFTSAHPEKQEHPEVGAEGLSEQ